MRKVRKMTVDQTIASGDRQILRELARRVAEIAALPIQAERIELWKAMNRLKPIRPLVAIYPERAWKELLPVADMQCEDRALRGWERILRQTIYQHQHIPDDRVLHADWLINMRQFIRDTGDGVEIKTRHAAGDGPQAIAWEPPIKSMADTEAFDIPEFSVDRETMDRTRALAEDVFGDILNVRVWGGQPWWSLGFSQLIHYRGLQQAMLDMYEQPELIHRIMRHIQACRSAFMDYLENERLLAPNNDTTLINYFMGSGHEAWTDELPADDFDGHARWKDMWVLGEMQEFSGVGPEQFWEFSLQYQVPLLNRCGLVNFGCCEPLDRLYDTLIREIPALRRLSVTSPYASKQVAAEKLADRHIFAWKPNPTPLATAAVDWAAVEADIRETLDVADGCCLELIMKSTETFAGDPARVTRWVETAQRLVAEHAG